jgi:hypothetical protein
MFFRVLSAMLAADAIDRQLRATQRPHGDQRPLATDHPAAHTARTTPAAHTQHPMGRFDPRAPERP